MEPFRAVSLLFLADGAYLINCTGARFDTGSRTCHTVGMSKVGTPFAKEPSAAEEAQSDALAEKRFAAIAELIRTLKPEDQQRLARELNDMLGASMRPPGVVLSLVRKLLPQQPEWTVAELKKNVDQHGLNASAKELYNVLGYLTRKRQVTRIAYGRYLVGGYPVETADDLGGERGRHEDLSDDQPEDRARR